MAFPMMRQSILASLLLGWLLILDLRVGQMARADWKPEWDRTIEAAKKEGQLSIYIGAYEGVLAEFKKAYPEIKVFSVASGTTEMATRVLAERRAGKYLADLFNGGVNTQYNMLHKTRSLDPLKDLFLLPEVVDESKWGEGYHFADPGPEFIKRFFGSMDITFSRDQRQMTDWLAAGKFALCIGCRAYEAKGQGLPVDYLMTDVWKEGGYTTAGIGALGYMNRAPHPNAAKVFVNWFLSRQGQTALQKIGRPGERPNSRRIDIPKEDVSPEKGLVPGAKYLDINRPDWQDMAPILNLGKSIMSEISGKKK